MSSEKESWNSLYASVVNDLSQLESAAYKFDMVRFLNI